MAKFIAKEHFGAHEAGDIDYSKLNGEAISLKNMVDELNRGEEQDGVHEKFECFN
jgi:hypothetical protein